MDSFWHRLGYTYRVRLGLVASALVLLACSDSGHDSVSNTPDSSVGSSDASGSVPMLTASAAWQQTGRMATGRVTHTSNTLASGRVLVAGGGNSTGQLSSAELFDPSTGTWSPTGSMTAARIEHRSALLADGRVLVAGGERGQGVILDSTELYDPALGTWRLAGAMTITRAFFAMAVLPNGKVLAAGGLTTAATGYNVSTATAELYDAALGTWTATGSLPVANSRCSCVVLGDGRVLLVGPDGAALYDAATGQWTTAPALVGAPHPEQSFLVRLRDGNVLMTGSSVPAQLYDPRADLWKLTAAAPVVRAGSSGALLASGKVLVAGGHNASTGRVLALQTADIFDPMTGSWSSAGIMNASRTIYVLNVLASGKVLLAGGREDNAPYSDGAELFDPSKL